MIRKSILILLAVLLAAPALADLKTYQDPFAGDDSPDVAELNQSEVEVWMGPYIYYGNVSVVTPLFMVLNSTKACTALATESECEHHPEGKKVLIALKSISSITVMS